MTEDNSLHSLYDRLDGPARITVTFQFKRRFNEEFFDVGLELVQNLKAFNPWGKT